jgi:hypothetical protein
MVTAFIAAAVLFTPSKQATQVYTDVQLGLSFTRPSTWTVDKPAKKPKKGDDSAHFHIPLSDSSETAELIIFRTQFSGSAETWQQIQLDVNKNLKREVERQWQQDVLGVPLLLTRIHYTEDGVSRTTLTGLLYNDNANKLQFRLTGPSPDFDKAQYEFTQTLQTLRTTDNTLPKEQVPGQTAKPEQVRGLKSAIFKEKTPLKPEVPPISVPLVVSTKNVLLRIPTGWTAEGINGTSLTLHSSAFPSSASVRLATTLDSDPPATAFIKISEEELNEYGTVELREDTSLNPNLAGAQILACWRKGSNTKGKLSTVEAVGLSGDYYFILTANLNYAEYLAQKKVLLGLLSRICIEAAAG